MVMEAVCKMINALPPVRVERFGRKEIEAGRMRQRGGNAVSTAVSVQGCFAALADGIEVWYWKERGVSKVNNVHRRSCGIL